ncbi:unnamed protein product [Orchesella dallaii]|uniref:Uncharacterized protein n=1 Tax=Orchesella dallaii TaxID=48710 RepID=A0ABP1PP94_9HEXA
MGKKTREPLKVDINSNMGENENDDFFLHDLLDVALKAGRFLFFGISYSISSSQLCCSEFTVKNHGKQKIFLRFLHFGFFLYLAVPFLTISISLSPCSLVNFIKKGLLVFLAIATLVAYYTLEVKGRHTKEGFVRIFQQCVVLQKKFQSAGLHFPSRYKIRIFGWLVYIVAIIFCIIRQYVFALKHSPWYEIYGKYFTSAFTLGFWTPDNVTS